MRRPPRFQWLAGHGNSASARQQGPFLAGFVYGGAIAPLVYRPPSGCKPRFAGFAVCSDSPRAGGVDMPGDGMRWIHADQVAFAQLT